MQSLRQPYKTSVLLDVSLLRQAQENPVAEEVKEMITLTKPEIENYATAHTEREPALLTELRKETYDHVESPQMLSGHLQGRFLKQLVAITNAERILEIGTFTGYSALCMAEGLTASGQVITCDVNPVALDIARRYFARSEYGSFIEVRQGPALETIKDLEPEFDMVFIDADKVNYRNYYDSVLPLVRFGGIIVVDNTLWSGEVLDPKDDSAKAIAAFNDYVINDNRVDPVMLPLRDGLTLIRKR